MTAQRSVNWQVDTIICLVAKSRPNDYSSVAEVTTWSIRGLLPRRLALDQFRSTLGREESHGNGEYGLFVDLDGAYKG
jgi:hypothetical protein